MGSSCRTRVWLVAFLALAVLLTACGTRDGGGRAINIDGSSTVFPITEAVAEEYGIITGGSVRITVGVSGTGGGFKKFCNKETDLADASRPIKAGEVEMCAENGVEYVELPVAVDGLTVMVHPDNGFVDCITVEELHTIWAPEAEDQVERWNQVRADWPDKSLHLYGPGVDSGTFDYFTEVVNGEAQASRGDFTASEDDNVLVQGISGDKSSLGFFGYAYYTENIDRLKAIAVDGGEGCVGPSGETIGDGTYSPLSRPLFIYVRKEAGDEAYINEFVRYFLSKEGRELVAEVGYIAYPDRVYELALARFDNGRTGTLFGGASPKRGSVEEVLAANQ
ncbi:MAG: PstS family phosphate ABC transporter substrate-binding protein [Dehalococcoidia bacterium]|jgi:phosphate transport system substrate-binding protein|nr:PstS family phosphate ABC transporter substrate-binding protein [Dehalococcoidia bacterium]MDP7511481.1 PstS family phosphate ABC transporter substrate-binding protein [Dehalococcoidia bacterium]